MFILNMPTDHRMICVDDNTKRYLEVNGFCPVSRIASGEWVFMKTKELLDMLSSRKGGNQDV